MKSIDLLKSLLEKYHTDASQEKHLSVEAFFIGTVKEEMKWNDLSDEEKQKKRKQALAQVKRWSSAENDKADFSVEEHVIALYDAIQDILDKIELLPEKGMADRLTVRMKSLLLIEKIFINEQFNSEKIRHVDRSIMANLIKDCEGSVLYHDLRLDKLMEQFDKALFPRFSGNPPLNNE